MKVTVNIVIVNSFGFLVLKQKHVTKLNGGKWLPSVQYLSEINKKHDPNNCFNFIKFPPIRRVHNFPLISLKYLNEHSIESKEMKNNRNELTYSILLCFVSRLAWMPIAHWVTCHPRVHHPANYISTINFYPKIERHPCGSDKYHATVCHNNE